MPCKRCGSRCQGRYCDDCAGDVRHGADATDDTQPPVEDTREYECSSCGHRWETSDPGGCPNCGAHRRRYVGPLEAAP